jgi:hypothetical protein
MRTQRTDMSAPLNLSTSQPLSRVAASSIRTDPELFVKRRDQTQTETCNPVY